MNEKKDRNYRKLKNAIDWRSQLFQKEKRLPGQIHDPEALLKALQNLGWYAPPQKYEEE